MRRLLAATLLMLAVGDGDRVDAAASSSSTAQASARVVEGVSVIGLLGSPVNLADVLAALRSLAAGPNTGSRLIRIPSLVPPDDPAAPGFGLGSEAGMAEAMAGARLSAQPDAAAGLLEGSLAAAISLAREAPGSDAAESGPVTITVDFN